VVAGPHRVQEGARAAERDPAHDPAHRGRGDAACGGDVEIDLADRDGFVEVAEALTDKRRRRRAVVTLLGACGTRFAPTSKLEEHLRAPRPFRHAPLTFFGSATSRRWTACARSRSSR